MSFVQASTVLAIAQSLDVGTVSEEAAKALAPDVEYRLRETVQEAQKFMRHAKRRTLTTDDINQALQLKNVQVHFWRHSMGMRNPEFLIEMSSASQI